MNSNRPEGYSGELVTSPLKAIKAKCLDCCCGQRLEVDLCTCNDCVLWPYRKGKNPFRDKKELSDEQRQAIRERFTKNNFNKSEED